jgi:hypothetical protein
VDVPDWQPEDWAYVLVRARAWEEAQEIGLGFNLKEGSGTASDDRFPFRFFGEFVDMFNDGSVQTYLLRADWIGGEWEGPWQQLGLWVDAKEPTDIDILSVQVIPKEVNYSSAPAGVLSEVRDRARRNTLYTHAPGRLEYRVRVPDAGRLDLGLGVLRDDPVTFRITAQRDGGDVENLLEEEHRPWPDRP